MSLESLPLASLVLDPHGGAVAVNQAWRALTGLGAYRSAGRGWLEAILPLDRELLTDRLRSAEASRRPGFVECRIAGPSRDGWTRWLWHPAGGEGLVVCVADIAEDKKREASLWQRATHDLLTGLVNRAEFLELLERALQRRDRAAHPPAVIYIDLDGFKTVNDTMGHGVGDGVLRAVAARMAGVLRPADIIARVGGDEFAVLLQPDHGGDHPEAVATRVRGSVRRSPLLTQSEDVLSATTGVAVARPGESGAELMARADEAMYATKGERAAQGSSSVPHRPVALLPRPPADPPDPSAPESTTAWSRDVDVSTPDGGMRMAADALVDAERLLGAQWAEATGNGNDESELATRLAVAARLAASARRALDPATLA